MARKPKAFVFDSWAVLAYFGDEAAAQQVADLISNAHDNRIPIYMSTVNVGEVWYIIAREISESDADQAIAELLQLGVEMIDAVWALTRVAAKLKANNKMSYADCYAAALAKEHKCALVTGDKEFKQLEGEISIHWL